MSGRRMWVWRVFVFLSVFGFVGRSFVTVAQAQTVTTPPVGALDDCKFVPTANTSTSVSGLSSLGWPGTGGGAAIAGAKCQTIALDITITVMPAGGDLVNWNYVPGNCGGYDLQKIMVSAGRLYAGGGFFNSGCGASPQSYQDIGPAVNGTRLQIDPFQGRVRNCAPASIAEASTGWKGIPQPRSLMTFVGSQATQIDTSRSVFGYWTGTSATPINGDGSYVYSDANGACSTSQPEPDPVSPPSPVDACAVAATSGSTTVNNLKTVAWSPSGAAILGGAKCQIVALDLTLTIPPRAGDLMTWNYVPSGCGSYYLQKLAVSGGRLVVGGGVFNSGCGASPQSYQDVGPAVPGMRIQFDPFQGRVRDCAAPPASTELAGPWRGLQQPTGQLTFTGSQATRLDMSRSRFDFWAGSTATPINGDGSYVFSDDTGACSTSQPAPDPVAPPSPVGGCTLNATGGSTTVNNLQSIAWSPSGSATITGAKCQILALDLTFPVTPGGGDIMTWNYVAGGCGSYTIQKLMVSGGRLVVGGGVFSCGCCPNTQSYQDVGPAVSRMRIQLDPFRGRVRHCAPVSLTELTGPWKFFQQPTGTLLFNGSQATRIDLKKSKFDFWSGSTTTPISGDGTYEFSDALGFCGENPIVVPVPGPSVPADGCKFSAAAGGATVNGLRNFAWSPSGQVNLSGAKCQLKAYDITFEVLPGGDIAQWNYVGGGCGSYYLTKLAVSNGRLVVGGGVFSCGCCPNTQNYQDVGPAVGKMRIQIDPYRGLLRDCAPPVAGTTAAGPWRGIPVASPFMWFTGSQALRVDLSRSIFGYHTGAGGTPINGDGAITYSNADGSCADPYVTGSVVTTTTTTTSTTTTIAPTTLSGALTASIVRGANGSAGSAVYAVTLKATGAVNGRVYEFVVPSGHVPPPLPPDPLTQRYPMTAANGEVVWQYTLVAPRGIYRAQVFAAGASTPLSSVEVK